MKRLPAALILLCLPALTVSGKPQTNDYPSVRIKRKKKAPAWATRQRRLMKLHGQIARLLRKAYFTEEGHFRLRMEHGGGTQAPDDVMESLYKLPMYYALGADSATWNTFWRAWKGTTEQGMDHGLYVNEMPKYLDWHHNGEHFEGFWLGALCAPGNEEYRRLALKYASLYDGSDHPQQNYDRDRKIIPSMLHGGAGPKIDQSIGDWIGGKITKKRRKFWKPWLASDHGGPVNLVTTNFGTVAFMLTGNERWRERTMEYIDAWQKRARDNGGIIPSIVKRDGTVPDDWWGGVMGWNFHRFGGLFIVSSGPRAAWGNAVLMTGDRSYFEPMRELSDVLWKNRHRVKKDLGWGVKKGDWDVPSHYNGKKKWHGGLKRSVGVYANMLANLWTVTGKEEDLDRVLERANVQGAAGHATWQEGGYEPKWIKFLAGTNDGWPERSLNRLIQRAESDVADLKEVVAKEPENRKEDVWPQHRGWVGPLVNQMTGGPVPLWHGQLHMARFRYFDPERKRPGIPEHCAALVRKLGDNTATLTLVNISDDRSHTLLVQGGAYAEHRIQSVGKRNGEPVPVNGSVFAVELQPGAVRTLEVRIKRFTNTPTLDFPWRRKK